MPPIPAWCANDAVSWLRQFRFARRWELGDKSTDRRNIQRSVAARAGRPAGRPPRGRGITAALRDLALIDTPGVLVSSNALSVAGQADDVVLVASHRVSLSHPRDARKRLGFVRAPSIGYVNLRSLGLGVRALWGWITPGIKSGTGIGKFAIDPEQGA